MTDNTNIIDDGSKGPTLAQLLASKVDTLLFFSTEDDAWTWAEMTDPGDSLTITIDETPNHLYTVRVAACA